jgi:hypothetical protein
VAIRASRFRRSECASRRPARTPASRAAVLLDVHCASMCSNLLLSLVRRSDLIFEIEVLKIG